MKHTVHLKTDIDVAIRHILKSIDAIITRESSHVFASVHVNGTNAFNVPLLQSIFGIKFDSDVERSVFEIILGHAFKTERMGPNGFTVMIKQLLKTLSCTNGIQQHFDKSEASEGILGALPDSPSSVDIDWVIKEYSSMITPINLAILRQAIKLAGMTGKIVVEKTQSDVASVELVRGYTFKLSPTWHMTAKIDCPHIICIDGFIESVSEINKLLQDASETKQPVILFARGFHEDVKQTLKVNYDRGSLHVIPVVVRFDLDGINTLKDIVVVAGCDMVSSLKGDLISNVNLREMPTIDSVVINHNKVVIMNFRASANVALHLQDLQRRRSETIIDDVASLLDARIRSLSPNHVVIRLPDDSMFVSSSQAIDYALRAVRSLVDHGSITIDGRKSLTTTTIAANVYSRRCHDVLTNLGAAITL